MLMYQSCTNIVIRLTRNRQSKYFTLSTAVTNKYFSLVECVKFIILIVHEEMFLK